MNNMARFIIASGFLSLLYVGTSCSSSSTGVDFSGVPRSATFQTLTTSQASILCDWVNDKQGGYGRSVPCSGGAPQTTDDSRTTCVAAYPAIGLACPSLTVADVEDCAKATSSDLCKFHTTAACAVLRDCFGGSSDGGFD